MRHHLSLIVMLLGLVGNLVACGWKPPTPSPLPPDACKPSDGPTADTVQQAVSTLPVLTPGSMWVEIARGHVRTCRLYWVQLIPSIARESTPQQLLFFDHNTSLGTPTPDPRPYITVLPPTDDTVTVQYQWQIGNEEPCCPTGIGTVKFQAGPDGKLKTLGLIPLGVTGVPLSAGE